MRAINRSVAQIFDSNGLNIHQVNDGEIIVEDVKLCDRWKGREQIPVKIVKTDDQFRFFITGDVGLNPNMDRGVPGLLSGETENGWRRVNIPTDAGDSFAAGLIKFFSVLQYPEVVSALRTFQENEGDRQEAENESKSDWNWIPSSSTSNDNSESQVENCLINLNEKARDGDFDPLIGRSEELERMVNILRKKNKNNPVLVGDPGVGKTAVVEGLARNIELNDEIPSFLENKTIFQLSLASLMGGTRYRGSLEDRLDGLLEFVAERPDVVLFVDELHSITNTNQGGNDDRISTFLKPALARGLSLIGATTHDDYKDIENDRALERRFQPVRVNEPDQETTRRILKRRKLELEDHHDISIPSELLTRVIDYSERYIPERRFPDKAIDLLDEASALATGNSINFESSGQPDFQDINNRIQEMGLEEEV